MWSFKIKIKKYYKILNKILTRLEKQNKWGKKKRIDKDKKNS